MKHNPRMVNLLNDSFDSLTSANQFLQHAHPHHQLDTSIQQQHSSVMKHPLVHAQQQQHANLHPSFKNGGSYMTQGVSQP